MSCSYLAFKIQCKIEKKIWLYYRSINKERARYAFMSTTTSIRIKRSLLDTKLQARNVIKDNFGGKLPSARPFRPDVRGRRPDVRPRPRLPRGRGFTRGRVFIVRQRGKNRVRAEAIRCLHRRDNASARTHLPPLPSPSLPPLPSPLSLPPLHADAKKEK
jgi:hypothetical protein